MPQPSGSQSSSANDGAVYSRRGDLWIDDETNNPEVATAASTSATTAALSYDAPVDGPIQYGPLTAQGNFVSAMDWPRAATLDVGIPDDFDANFSNQSYIANQQELGLDPWLDTNTVDVSSHHFNLYDDILESQYDDATLADTSGIHAQQEPLADFTTQALSTYSPYDGIWAYNPLAVDDNFVYPAAMSTTRVTIDALPAASQASAAPMPLAINTVPPISEVEGSSTISPRSIAHPFPTPAPTTRIGPTPVADRPLAGTTNKKAAAVMSKSSRPERAKRNRTAQSQAVVPRRQGPLSTAQRQKADDMRYYGACWRCRRYKKPCNGPGTCDTCLTSGFRVWPSTIGCYRGNMEDFIVGVMPGNAEQVINGMTFDFKKVPNWKTLFGYRPDMSAISYTPSSKDKYEALSIKLQATRMAGRGFIELLDVLANYQRSRDKPDTCLELACSALNHICDIYHAFVETDTPIHLNASELLNALTRFRSAYSDNWRHFLQLCLSGRRSAWFPAFLCACINVPLLVVLKDGFVAIPEPARTTLWPNISFLIEDLRNRLYPMGLDLLSALAKGIKPWKLRCWGWKERLEADGTVTVERDPDGMRLLAGDVGAFDGFAAVQSWLDRNRDAMLDGVSFLTTPPFSERNAKMQPIAALAWIFEVERAKEQKYDHKGGQIVVGAA